MNAQILVLNEKIWTKSGMLRIRWWPLAGAGILGGLYAALNLVTFIMVAGGGKGSPGAYLHAPLSYMFG